MRPALRRQFQPIALRVIAEGGGSADISRIRQAIEARHPGIKWDRRYPIKVLADNGIVEVSGTTLSLVEQLDPHQIASLLSALDERAVRTHGLRVRLNPSDESNLKASKSLEAAGNSVLAKRRDADAASDARPCPHCAEEIKNAAIVCRFCGRDVPVAEGPR